MKQKMIHLALATTFGLVTLFVYGTDSAFARGRNSRPAASVATKGHHKAFSVVPQHRPQPKQQNRNRTTHRGPKVQRHAQKSWRHHRYPPRPYRVISGRTVVHQGPCHSCGAPVWAWWPHWGIWFDFEGNGGVEMQW